ncbi:hypothetical protein [Bacillus sp. GB_SG_008]|uniref:hypothetical protein n=1 Tax=Bacillus sp. GB_SG_008 TaxID=3454627 RepID=UPI003F8754EF
MEIKIKKQDFDLLTCADLSQRCFEPLIKTYKKRVVEQTTLSSYQIKQQFYEQLTEGQRALFMFYAYYNHVSKSLTEFYWWSAYFMAQPQSWAALKAGIRYFRDESMLSLLEKIERELKYYNHPETLEDFSITREELDKNKRLQASIESLHIIFENTSPFTVKKINNHIEKNLQDFVEIKG